MNKQIGSQVVKGNTLQGTKVYISSARKGLNM